MIHEDHGHGFKVLAAVLRGTLTKGGKEHDGFDG